MQKFIFFAALTVASFSYAEEPSFKFTFGSNFGKFPIEISSIDKNKKNKMGLKINKWVLSPNFSSFTDSRILSNFSNNKSSNDDIFIKFKLNF